MGVVPEMSVGFEFSPSKKLCGKLLILSFSARDGCINRKPRGEKNDQMHNSQRLFVIFSPFFTRFGRERPVEKPRRAVFSLVFVLEIAGEIAVLCKGFAKTADLARTACGGEGKVGKRVFFAGFPFGLSQAVCARVQEARPTGCAARQTMKGSWAKSRHVSHNSCALSCKSRVVLPPQTQQPHPRRQGEGGVGEMWPPRRCSGAGRTGRSGTARREGRATRRNGNGTCHRCGAEAPRKRGTGRSGHRSALVRARSRIRSEDRHHRGRRRDDRRRCRAAWDGSCRRDARRPDGLRGARAVWHRRRC